MEFFALILFSILLIVLSVFDVVSTDKALTSGNANEANPIMAYFQRTLGSYWVVVKLIVLFPIIFAWLIPRQYGVIALFVLVCIYAVTVKNNYDLADGK